MSHYNKFWAAIVAAAVVIGTSLADGTLTGVEIAVAVETLLGAGAVWTVPNRPKSGGRPVGG